ncbi:hypothetical protein K1T71_010130 [Dendrolimus kikuchii]|uniref:Uncharacterized protein n=1 Tax=Dendrolimus kikuchii TaxID=765133 RepID=A0ACC1CQR1_9NEOP|nr:hypothetical protein K1T71_010130 [Dendrolimus kikuchii]
MSKLSENYYLRDCYFKREQVPTQSVMMEKMSPCLAKVYFKSMSPKLKILAVLEPPMKGGGNDWYIPPKVLLEEGRVVMKSIKHEYIKKLGCEGIGLFGEQIVKLHHQRMEEEKNKVLLENDINWKKTIDASCRQHWEDSSKQAAKKNTEAIQQAFQEFTALYTTSISKIESLLFEAAVKQIKRTREYTFQMMNDKLTTLVKRQATMLYDRYTEKLDKEKARLKMQFIENIEKSRMAMGEQIHDIRAEKYVAIEKLRNLLECQKLACQVYVALKEREECQQELELSKHEHKKKVKFLQEQIALKDFEIKLAKEKERRRDDFKKIWQKKVCEVVKKFQVFVSYCLNTLPEHADFFIDMEKLMLLQLNETLDNPSVESIFQEEEPKFHEPVPRPHPFFLFCDKGYKPDLNQRLDLNLCPKHCTSSASQLPVIIVNRRCIYAACDNFDIFTDKIKEYIHGKRGNDADFEGNHSYTYDIPFKCTSSQEILQLKLESSLLQILQTERPNLNQVPVECCLCKIPYCFCSPLHAASFTETVRKDVEKAPSLASMSSGKKVETRSVELEHEREPKWESYMKFIEPKKCKCAKTAKKHLIEHLPAYMRNMSIYDPPELPNYEPCSMAALKRLVRKARGRRTPLPEPAKIESKTKDISTQYSDQEFDNLCTCFSDDEVKKLIHNLMHGSISKNKGDPFQYVGGNISPTYLQNRTASFATQRAYSLRNLLDEAPDLEEIFKNKECAFE